jgi:hypothetical protein
MASEPISRMLYTSSCSVWSQPLKPHVSQHMRCYIHVVQLSNWRPPNRLWLDSNCLLGDFGLKIQSTPSHSAPSNKCCCTGRQSRDAGEQQSVHNLHLSLAHRYVSIEDVCRTSSGGLDGHCSSCLVDLQPTKPYLLPVVRYELATTSASYSATNPSSHGCHCMTNLRVKHLHLYTHLMWPSMGNGMTHLMWPSMGNGMKS